MHSDTGGYVKPMVFGGLDGIMSSFAVVARYVLGFLSRGNTLNALIGFSVAGASFDPTVVLILVRTFMWFCRFDIH
jgi:hypothetical protein